MASVCVKQQNYHGYRCNSDTNIPAITNLNFTLSHAVVGTIQFGLGIIYYYFEHFHKIALMDTLKRSKEKLILWNIKNSVLLPELWLSEVQELLRSDVGSGETSSNTRAVARHKFGLNDAHDKRPIFIALRSLHTSSPR